jgi:putative copper export protein
VLVEFLAGAPAHGVVRFALLAGLLAVLGVEVAAWRLVPVIARHAGDAASRVQGRLRRLERAMVGVLAAVVILRLVQQAAAFAETPSAWPTAVPLVLQKTMWGRGWLLQAISLTVVAATRVQGRGVLGAVRLAALVGLAIAPALSGHAIGAPRLALTAVATDAAHVLAGAVWIGTLAAMAAAAGAERRVLSAPTMLGVLGRFSPLALGSAVVLAATGAFASWLHLETPSALWATPYGRTLLLKLACTACIAAVGAFNWRVATPRLAASGTVTPLARAVVVELGLACILLGVTAALIVTPLPAEG